MLGDFPSSLTAGVVLNSCQFSHGQDFLGTLRDSVAIHPG